MGVDDWSWALELTNPNDPKPLDLAMADIMHEVLSLKK